LSLEEADVAKVLHGKHLAIGLVTLGLVGLSGCAKTQAQEALGAAPTTQADVGGAGRPVDWDHPLSTGLLIDDANEAESSLAFRPVIPDPELGIPSAIYISDPARLDSDERELAFVYVHPTYGQFLVIEFPSGGETQKDLEASVAECAPECAPDYHISLLENGLPAIVSTNERSSGAEWIDQETHVMVVGPPGTFTTDFAFAVANYIPALDDVSPSPTAS
jgi:hypothetical protein